MVEHAQIHPKTMILKVVMQDLVVITLAIIQILHVIGDGGGDYVLGIQQQEVIAGGLVAFVSITVFNRRGKYGVFELLVTI